MAALAAVLSLATTSEGVPLGAQKPCHVAKFSPGKPASSAVGTFGAADQRVFVITASALILPARV